MLFKNTQNINKIYIKLICSIILIISTLTIVLTNTSYAKAVKETINDYNLEFNTENLDFLDDYLDDHNVFLTYSLKENNVILMQNENMRINPASITKIVPCILAIKNLDLNESVQILESDTVLPKDYIKVPLIPGEYMTVNELLHFALIPSCNDASKALARLLNDNNSTYEEKVKKLFEELNMQDTNFTNSYGFADPNHYTTANDLAKLTRYVLNDDIFLSIISKKHVNVPPYASRPANILNTTNKYLLDGPFKNADIFGVKTGYNNLSKYCFISAKNIIVRNSPDKIICIVANLNNEDDRYYLSNKLYLYTEHLLENKINTSLKWNSFIPRNPNIEHYAAYLIVILLAVFIFKPRNNK